ncbi:hypothetical protein MMC13_006783 [Lambiella insularis]|nr:hypothetical protein [Lambiella insularis]
MAIIEATRDTPHHLQQIADILASAKKVVVFTGAGISTNCGIPDFRSKSGLYNLINADYNAQLSSSPSTLAVRSTSGKDLFDSSLWKDELSTSVFRTFVASLRRKIREDVQGSTATHRFIRHLRDQKRLVRCYTQNIDGLEAREGLCADLRRGKGSKTRFSKKAMQLPNSAADSLPGSEVDRGCEVVQLHGDLETLRCTICGKSSAWDMDDSEGTFLAGQAPQCQYCREQDQLRRGRGKRGTAVGVLRPNIVLYGEEHPSSDVVAAISINDLKLGPDTIIILGTSLQVYGFKGLVKEFAKVVHAKKGSKGSVIYVNLTKPAESIWTNVVDYWVAMDCDDWVRSVKARRPDSWQTQAQLSPMVSKTTGCKSLYKMVEKAPELDEKNKENPGSVRTPQSMGSKKLYMERRPLLDQEAMDKKPIPNITAEVQEKTRSPWEPEQLPTPPPSYHKHSGERYLLHEAGSLVDEDTIVVTPSKHRKMYIKIWEDVEADATITCDSSQARILSRECTSSTKAGHVFPQVKTQADKAHKIQNDTENGAVIDALGMSNAPSSYNTLDSDKETLIVGEPPRHRPQFHVQVPARNTVGGPPSIFGLKRKRA